MLDKDQYTIYQEIMSEAERFHIISGGPGTGKSFLIHALNHGIRSIGRQCVVTASTGVAAFLVGGTTKHSKLLLRYFENTLDWRTLLFNGTNLKMLE